MIEPRAKMGSIADHRDDGGIVSPTEFEALQRAAQEMDERLKRLESVINGSDPPPRSDSLDVTLSRSKGVRLRGSSFAVAMLLAALGGLAAITYAATKWGPPARWQAQSATEGAGGR
jgi:ferric-dicitrate binding protein FerR (iron transport regulator)